MSKEPESRGTKYEVDSYLTCQKYSLTSCLAACAIIYTKGEIGGMEEKSRFEKAAYLVSDDSHPESDADFAEWLRSKRVHCEVQKGEKV